MPEEVMDIPLGALTIALDGGALLQEQQGADDDDTRRFAGVAHTGKVIPNHWFWGNFAVDLDGMRVPREDIPVLLDHFHLLGFTTKVEKNAKKGLQVEGTLINASDKAAETLRFMAKGMPFQMSVYVPPDRGGIEQVAEGATAEVNGQKLKGPGAIFRKSTLREVTITALGADDRTSAALLKQHGPSFPYQLSDRTNHQDGEEEMPTPNEMTVALLKEKHLPVHDEIFKSGMAAGVTAERERLRFIHSKSKGVDEALVTQAIAEGWDERETACKFLDYVTERKEARLAQLGTEHGTDKAHGVDDAEETDKEPDTFREGGAGDEKKRSTEEMQEGPERWREEFKQSKDLQDEFGGDADAYVAYRQHPESRRERRTKATA